MKRLEETAGKRFGDDEDPLLVSVRSGARESMPGMLDTILNVGLNDTAVVGLATATDNERFAWDSYRRLVRMFGDVASGVSGEKFEDAIAQAKRDEGVETDNELSVDALKGLVERDAGPRDHARRQGGGRPAAPRDHDPALRHELEIMRALVVSVGKEHGLTERDDYTVGTMIELPRACFIANRIARHADFFSFGTNDLTQTALGFSRDDAESKFMPTYIERKILDRSPFETIDSPGVGWLVRLAAWVGREEHPGLKLGICGEHGGIRIRSRSSTRPGWTTFRAHRSAFRSHA